MFNINLEPRKDGVYSHEQSKSLAAVEPSKQAQFAARTEGHSHGPLGNARWATGLRDRAPLSIILTSLKELQTQPGVVWKDWWF